MFLKIKYLNHPLLGNSTFDFSKKDGTPYKNIILIGENGSGKTQFLKSVSDLVIGGNLNYIDSLSLTYNSTICTIFKDSASGRYLETLSPEPAEIKSTIYRRETSLLLKQGCAYSGTRVNYEIDQRSYQSPDNLDSTSHTTDDGYNYSYLLNLFYNLHINDLENYKKINQNKILLAGDEFDKDSRIGRFTYAFNNFFDELKFGHIDSDVQNIRVYFTKYGKDIEIEALSSGEKQIVFRGANILKNKDLMKDGVIIIDEPELSLHPEWQKKIVDFYKNIFSSDGNQTSQIFIATHSENVIYSALKSRDDTLVIRMKGSPNGSIVERIETDTVLPNTFAAEINYVVYGVDGIAYHSLLYGYLQYILGDKNVKDTDSYIENDNPYFEREKHYKEWRHGRVVYKTLPSYIRNASGHPFTGKSPFSDEELNNSIKLLRTLIINYSK